MGQVTAYIRGRYNQRIHRTTMERSQKMLKLFEHDGSLFGGKIETAPSSRYDYRGYYNLAVLGVTGDVQIPDLIVACVEFMKRNKGLQTNGVFRVPGDFEKVMTLKQKCSVNGVKVTAEFLECNHCDVHTVSSLLKGFLRELREPLMTFELYSVFLETQKSGDWELVFHLVQAMPALHKGIVLYLLCFLVDLWENEDTTCMGIAAIALLFSQNMLRPRVESIESIVRDYEVKRDVFVSLIRAVKYIENNNTQ